MMKTQALRRALLALLSATALASTFAPGMAHADWNVTIGSASSNGAWSGASPDVWTPSASGATVAASEINTRLNAGTPVVITAVAGSGAEAGNISVRYAITSAQASASLTLTPGAGGSYSLSSPITLSGATPSLSIAGTAYTVINDVTALQAMSGNLAGNYALGSDIDASATSGWNGGQGFVPIGNNTTKFTGNFDGLGHTIAGLTVNRPATTYVGLFGHAQGGTLSNVNLSNLSVTGNAEVGGLTGKVSSGSISNVIVSGSVSGSTTPGFANTGGLVGQADASTVSRSASNASVSGAGSVGGLIGHLAAASNISQSYATGNVTGAQLYVGGLVGMSSNPSTVTDSYATGNVSGSSLVGGVVGSNGSTVSNVFATGTVSGTANVGGVVGSNGHTVSNAYWDTTTSGIPTAGIGGGSGTATNVTGLTTAGMKTLANFSGAGWAIDDAGGSGKTWRIYDGYSYPLLRGFLTALSATPDYDGSGTALTNVAAYTASGAYDPAKVLGTAGSTLTLASTAADAYTATVKGLYSTQQGYDLVLHRTVATVGSAAGDVVLNNPVTWTSGTLAINTTGTATANAAISGTGTAVFDLQAGVWYQVNASLPGFSARDFRISGGTFVRALSGDGTVGTPYQLADIHGVQGMGSSGMLGKNYQLAADVDASGTANWNGNLGFTPVGFAAGCGACFTGKFDGLGHTISNLSINRDVTLPVGLFGNTENAVLQNVGLLNVNIYGGSGGTGALAGKIGTPTGGTAVRNSYADGGSVKARSRLVGGLVGVAAVAADSISYSYANVSVESSDGGFATDAVAGGLVGSNAGSISYSYATGSVTGKAANPGNNIGIGGLVGRQAAVGSISNSYATGAVSAVGGGTDLGGLVGQANAGGGSVTSSYWDKTTTGQATSANVTGGGGAGLLTAAMKTLATYSGAGWAIDDAGGTANVWRIYDTLSYPLLRNFFTATLTASAGSGSKTYDGSTATALGVTYSATPNAHLLGTASVVAASSVVGTQATRVAGIYSDQLGYDISYVNGTLNITAAGQTITGLAATPASGIVGGTSTLSVTGSGASGNAVVYASATASICTVSGNTVSYVAVGACRVTADQAGNGTYSAAPQVSLNISAAQHVASYSGPTATGSGTAAVTATGGGPGCTFGTARFLPLSSVAAPPPAGVSFPQGLFDFTLSGCTPAATVTLRIDYPQALPSGTQYWKYGPTPTDHSNHWYQIPATVSGASISFSITDGGPGDDDLTANGSIVDAGGAGNGSPTGIPTLSEWGLLLLMGLMALLGMAAVRRRSPA